MFRRRSLHCAATIAAAVGLSASLAPAASAQLPALPELPAGSADPATASAGLPTIESAPAPFQPPSPIVLTYPVLGPARPAPEYSNVTIFPTENETVGVAQPIHFFFDKPITDRARAEATIGIRTAPAVPGKFYWISDTELRWRPLEFWPVNSTVTIWAQGRQHTFRTGDALVATYDDRTKRIVITHNGRVVREMLASVGMPGWETYNGIYYAGTRKRVVRMTSAPYGLPVDAPGGYDALVYDAVRLSYDGIYIHAAPWSIADQGVRNVSNGCINVSPEDAKWYFENSRTGDPFIVKNTTGRQFGAFDGQGDWNY